MQATFKIKAEEFNESLLNKIKKMFEGKSVTITITTETDETAYLTASSANKEHLMKSIASEPTVCFTSEEFEKHVEELLKKSDTTSGK